MIGYDLAQIRANTIQNGRILIDKWGRMWRGVTGFAASTYTHDANGGTIVPSDGDGGEAWLLLNSFEGHIPVPVPSTAFANGTTNGVDPTVYAFRLNNAIDNQPLIALIGLPNDVDPDAPMTVDVRIKLTGSTDTTVKTVLVARINGGSDIGGTSTTNLTTTTQTISFTLTAANVPTGARSLYLEIDCDGSLDTDDALIYSASVRYQRL